MDIKENQKSFYTTRTVAKQGDKARLSSLLENNVKELLTNIFAILLSSSS